MTRRILMICCALALAACSGDGPAASQLPSTPPTTTTTTAPPTTTTTTTTPPATIPAFSEISFPTDPLTVGDLPVILSSLDGAPVPEPDLSIDGPDDIDRWIAEVFNWMAWAAANPAEAADHTTDVFQISSQAANELGDYWQWRADHQWPEYGWPFEPHDAAMTAGDLEDGDIEIDVAASRTYLTYSADETGRITQVIEPPDWLFLIRISAHQSRDGMWRVAKFKTMSPG